MRKELKIEGRRVSYLERMASDARQTLVLLHAFPLHAEMWASQFAALPPDWRLIAPDFRGFGQSDGDRGDLSSADLSLEDYARDVLGLLDQLDVRAPVVAGLSLGGYVTFAMLRIAPPDAIRGLVLADTRPQADTEEGRAGRRRMIDLVGREGAAGIATEMMSKLIADQTRENHPAVADFVRNMILTAPPPAIAAALYRMMARPDSTGELARIACPTLVIVGERDALTPPDLSRDMQKRIVGARLEVVPSAGHLANLEQPDAFNTAVAAFLKTA
ncbi:MAG: alpha/beta fold hydrolase [Acidobacteria bacterium]|nr:MAG: alpha/beta fold hydrolase [Acidobacteriota bacterium]